MSKIKNRTFEPWMAQRLKEGVERRIEREYAESLGIKTVRARRKTRHIFDDYDEEWERELTEIHFTDEW